MLARIRERRHRCDDDDALEAVADANVPNVRATPVVVVADNALKLIKSDLKRINGLSHRKTSGKLTLSQFLLSLERLLFAGWQIELTWFWETLLKTLL